MTSTPTSGPGQYSHGHQPSVLASHAARTAANSCGYFLDRLGPGLRVLDLGCGPGSITLDLAERVAPGEVVGVDFSPQAIESARQAAQERGDHATRFVTGDLFNLDVEPGSFDVVHAHQVLQHVPDPVGALRAMERYCAPGGIIAIRDADYGAMAWFPASPGLDMWHETYCTTARQMAGEPDAGRRLRAWANAAGLEVLTVGSSTWTYATVEATGWWGTSQADRVLTSSFTDRATAAGLNHSQIEQIAHDWRQWAAHPDACFFLPHGELIARKATR